LHTSKAWRLPTRWRRWRWRWLEPDDGWAVPKGATLEVLTPMPQLMGGGGLVIGSPATDGSGPSEPPWHRIYNLFAWCP
jgi:hypothetical protein